MSDIFNPFDETADPEEIDEPGPERELVFSDPVEFFTGIFGRSYVRQVNDRAEFAWCPQWYKHLEAYARMEAIWRAWEHLRLDGTLGPSTWWTTHADPHMRVLMATNGPFKNCIYDGHKEADPQTLPSLPHIEPEKGIYNY